MQPKRGEFGDLVSVGGAACLDFVNTVSGWGTAAEFDRLEAYGHLPDWAHAAGLISQHQGRQLKRVARTAPGQAKACFEHATALRRALYQVSVGAIRDAMAPADIAEMSSLLFPLLASSGFELDVSEQLELRPQASSLSLHQPLWFVAWSAFWVFTSDERQRLRQCENNGCTWLFLDRSKNHSRRWCSMDQCGAVVKAREYRARRRARSNGA